MTVCGTANVLLSALPSSDYERLMSIAEEVTLPLKQVLHEPEDEVPYAYFPLSGVISLLTVLDDGSAVEIATVGCEGMADFAAYLGMESPARWLVQVPGSALRFRPEQLREYAAQSGTLQSVMHHYMLTMFVMVSQTAACNRRHPVEERCARWLLLTHDRVRGSVFPMTHEFLADMLGVRRPSVSIAMGMLSKAGFVQYRRGQVRVLDREGLESAACDCYRLLRERFETAFPQSEVPGK